MNPRILGWTFVGAQAALLALLIFLPGGDDWPTPDGLRSIGDALIVVGLLTIVTASLRLGTALTATPVPTNSGSLTTTGLYRFVRHPIYTAVLAIVLGLAIRSGSFRTAAVGVATFGFFHLKARWEERQLALRYPDYPEYAAHTPRFFPLPTRRSERS